ncbi:MAG: hypothetical protein ACP5SJ_03615 [Candidatus Micrarchaeia archaeon]
MDDFESLRKRMLENAKQGIRRSYESEEYALIQAINAYLQLSKSYNLLYERLSEWLGIYVPELGLQTPKQLMELSLALAEGSTTKERLSKIFGNTQLAESTEKKIGTTIGRKWAEDEKAAFANFASLGISVADTLESLEGYIAKSAERIMPNVTYLTDPKIAAELLSKAGSLERMALMPASTIQLLGAEKALFKHIKFGSKSPKYGVLFKLPKVSGGRRDLRGKIARIYATKISIALKADYFSKRFIAKELKASLDESIRKIEAQPEKKRSEGRAQPQNRWSRGGRQRSPGPHRNFKPRRY